MILREAAESLFASHVMSHGFHVSFPAAQPPYDLVVDCGSQLVRVQIKTSDLIVKNRYKFSLKRKYSQKECDVVVLHPVGTELFAILLPEDFRDRLYFTLDVYKHRHLLNNYSRLCSQNS